jgi:hypothetical protein
MKNRIISWLLAGSVVATTFVVAPAVAVASPEGRKNTALLLGAGALGSFLQRKHGTGLILGAAGVYAYKRYRDSKQKRAQRRAYASGYRRASSAARRSYGTSRYRTAGYRTSYSRRSVRSSRARR